jgi:hypothetical protein
MLRVVIFLLQQLLQGRTSDKKTTKLSSADTEVTMTPAAQESFKQCRKCKTVKKNEKLWSENSGKP